MNGSRRKSGRGCQSVILQVLHRFCAWLYAWVLDSMLGHLLTGTPYRREERGNEGFLHHLLHSRKKRSDRWFFRFCQALSATLEKSLFCRLFGVLGRALLHASMNSYGIFFLFLGCYSIVSYYILGSTSGDPGIVYLFTGGTLVLIAIPLFASSRSMAWGLRRSVLLRTLVVHGFGIAEERLTSYGDKGKERYVEALILALALGTLTLAVPPHVILVAAACALAVCLILRDPEIGMVLSVAALPFLTLTSRPTMVLLAMVAVTLLGFVIKLLCGKRSLRMEAVDWLVLALLVMLAWGGIVTRGGEASLYSALTYVCLGAIYFVIANLVRSRTGVVRMMTMLLASCTLVASIGILQYVFSTPSMEYLDLNLFADFGGRVTSTWENPNMLAEYLALLIPLSLSTLLLQKRLLRGFGAAICFAIAVVCLVFTWTRGAWLGTLVALFIFVLLLSHKALSWTILGALPAAALVPLLPETVLRRFASIGSRTDTSILYRIHLWDGVERMLDDWWLTGVGVGESAFCAVYGDYALPGIETAMHSHNLYLQILCSLGIVGLLIFGLTMLAWLRRALGYMRYGQKQSAKLVVLGGVAGVVALLVMGAFDDVWYNYRIYMLFWALVGLVIAQVRIGERETERENNPVEDKRTQGEIVFHFR